MRLFGEINVAMFDWPWSGIHCFSGFIIGLFLGRWQKSSKNFWQTGLGLLILWELVEISLRYFDIHAHETIAPLKQAVGGFAFAPETNANIIGDLIIGSVGLAMGRFVGKRM